MEVLADVHTDSFAFTNHTINRSRKTRFQSLACCAFPSLCVLPSHTWLTSSTTTLKLDNTCYLMNMKEVFWPFFSFPGIHKSSISIRIPFICQGPAEIPVFSFSSIKHLYLSIAFSNWWLKLVVKFWCKKAKVQKIFMTCPSSVIDLAETRNPYIWVLPSQETEDSWPHVFQILFAVPPFCLSIYSMQCSVTLKVGT